jgi:hypothetical protein
MSDFNVEIGYKNISTGVAVPKLVTSVRSFEMLQTLSPEVPLDAL